MSEEQLSEAIVAALGHALGATRRGVPFDESVDNIDAVLAAIRSALTAAEARGWEEGLEEAMDWQRENGYREAADMLSLDLSRRARRTP